MPRHAASLSGLMGEWQNPDCRTDQYHIDILAAHFVAHPEWFDVVVASNLFGDILSDLSAAVVGSIGLAPSANLNPDRNFPSMFEPVHGSAPDIAGKGIANPTALLYAACMMLDHVERRGLAQRIRKAVDQTLLEDNVRTGDLGGKASTAAYAEAIVRRLS